MKKIFTFIFAFLASIGLMNAETIEKTGTFGSSNVEKDNELDYTAFTIAATYNAGGAAKVNVYGSDMGIKLRANNTGLGKDNTFVFSIKEHITITALEMGVVTNDGSEFIPITAVYVDGELVDDLLYPINTPNTGNASGATIINLSGIAAKENIGFECDLSSYNAKNKQVFVAGMVTYEELVLTELAAPEITFDGKTGIVTIGAVANATKVVYTTDGTDPTAESTVYSAPFTVADGTVVKTMAIGNGESYANSAVASVEVLIGGFTVEKPVITHCNGIFALSTATNGATCEYSVDGGTTWLTYTGPVTLTEKTKVKAHAIRENCTTSDEVEAEIEALAALPEGTTNVLLGAGGFENIAATEEAGGILKGLASDAATNGYSIAIGKAGAGWSIDNDKNHKITISSGVTRGHYCGEDGVQNTVTLPEGVKVHRVTFYSYMADPDGVSGWKEVAGTDYDNYIPFVSKDNTKPDVRAFNLGGKSGSFTFTNAGKCPNFVMVLDVVNAQKLAAPEITFDGKTGTVTIGAVANATKVVYTTDGVEPTAESTSYSAQFTVDDGTVVKAMAIGDGDEYVNSAVASVEVLIGGFTVEKPVITHCNGIFALSTATNGATCEYSVDGGTTWLTYTAPVTLSEKTKVKARASRENCTTSDEVEAEIEALAALPEGTTNVLLGAGGFENVAATEEAGGVLKGLASDAATNGYSIAIGKFGAGWTTNNNTKITISEKVSRGSYCGADGVQNTVTLPEGVKVHRVTFYSYMADPDGVSGWKEVAGTNYDNYIPFVSKDNTKPDVRAFNLGGKTGSFTFTNAGKCPNFVMVLDVVKAEKLATPVISSDKTTGEVTITAVENGKVYYTIDGTVPTAASTEYTEPFIVANETVVKAIALGDGDKYINSDVAEKTVKIVSEDDPGNGFGDEALAAPSVYPLNNSSMMNLAGGINLTFAANVEVAEGSKATLGDKEVAMVAVDNQVFIAYEGLEPLTEYTLTVPSGSIGNDDAQNTEDLVYKFTTRMADVLFFSDFNIYTQGYYNLYGNLSGNVDIIAKDKTDVTAEVGGMTFYSGTKGRVVAMKGSFSADPAVDYGPNDADKDAGASTQAVQLIAGGKELYVEFPEIQGPAEVTFFLSNPDAKAVINAVLTDENGDTANPLATFELPAVKKIVKCTYTYPYKGDVKLRLYNMANKLNINDALFVKGEGEGEEKPVYKDETAPVLTYSWPSAEPYAPVEGNIVLVYSEPIVASAKAKVNGVESEIKVDGNTATIAYSGLEKGKTYKVEIPAIADEAGNATAAKEMTLATEGADVLFYTDYNYFPYSYWGEFHMYPKDGVDNGDILAKNSTNKTAEFGGITYSVGATAGRVVAMGKSNIVGTNEIGASQRCAQFSGGGNDLYAQLPEVQGPAEITLLVGNSTGNEFSFELRNGDSSSEALTTFKTTAEKTMQKFSYVFGAEEKVSFRIYNMGNQFNLHDILVVKSQSTGIEGMDAAEDADVVYYNLQGQRVNNPAGGIYIRVKGNNVEKVMLK